MKPEIAVQVESTAVEPAKDYKLTFTFKVSLRQKMATDFCNTQVESVLDEGDGAEDWTCGFEPIASHEAWKVWTVFTFTYERIFIVTEEVFKGHDWLFNRWFQGDDLPAYR